MTVPIDEQVKKLFSCSPYPYTKDSRKDSSCCDMDQSDIIGKIELIPFSDLSSNNTN